MPNRKYIAGAYFERRVRDYYRDKGWVVWRTPGSKSPCDLIAVNGGEWVLIQCQLNSYFEPKKIDNLKRLCDDVYCRGLLVWRDDKNKIQCKEVK